MNKVFVLDTNVLMHDPAALYRFQEHDVYIPMTVLEELDGAKKGVSEVARNVRQVSRFLDELMADTPAEAIEAGIPLTGRWVDGWSEQPSGRLYFQTRSHQLELPAALPGNRLDNHILGTVLALQEQWHSAPVILVSKDINLRIKAAVLGLRAEDYYNDQVLDDVDLLPSGFHALMADFWARHTTEWGESSEPGRTVYRLQGPEIGDWHPGDGIYDPQDEGFEAIVRRRDGTAVEVERIQNYRAARHTVWGINARNREQNFALNLLMDPEIDFVTLLGPAGTGKTLLALAAGLVQTLEENRYREILMTRMTVPVGEDIGYLPGTEEEKMTPWMGALMDNLEVLGKTERQGSWEQAATNDLLRNRIKIRSANFMRGRTFLNKYIIIDEGQNITAKQMKTLITRAGPGTKVVCLGNIAQIDTPYLTETTSGLTYVIDRFRGWPHGGHVTLTRGERSRLADYASECL